MHDLEVRLNSAEESERLFAVQDIADANPPDAALRLAARLGVEESQVVRDAIVFSLRSIPRAEIFGGLFDFFRSADAYLRNAAVNILGMDGEEAIVFLTSHLDDADREVRKLILDALFQIGSQNAVLAIRACLHDRAPNVQITAVEYLGRLEDKASIPEMLAILERESEPMLRSTILESLRFMGNGASISKIFSSLMPEGNTSQIDPFCLPQVLGLVAKAGELEDLYRVIDSVHDTSSYADDIMRAIGQSKQRFKERFDCARFLDKVLAIAGNKEVREDVRYSSVAHILGKDCGSLASEKIYSLGCSLMEEEAMVYAGVRLLARCGMIAGKEKIREVMEATRDEDLRALCLELMAQD